MRGLTPLFFCSIISFVSVHEMSKEKLLSLLSLLEHTISEIRNELTEEEFIDESVFESSPIPLDDYDEVFYDDE